MEPELSERLQLLRSRSAAALRSARQDGPSPEADILGAIAWVSQFPEPEPFDLELHELIRTAVYGQRFRWQEISVALGEGDNPVDERRVRQRWTYRDSKL